MEQSPHPDVLPGTVMVSMKLYLDLGKVFQNFADRKEEEKQRKKGGGTDIERFSHVARCLGHQVCVNRETLQSWI